MLVEYHFRAMNTDVGVWLWSSSPAAKSLLYEVEEMFQEVESHLSRFRADSELSRLNAQAGRGAVAGLIAPANGFSLKLSPPPARPRASSTRLCCLCCVRLATIAVSSFWRKAMGMSTSRPPPIQPSDGDRYYL